MTTPISPLLVCSFDHAFDAATLIAGWPPEAGFLAVMTMLASGLTAAQVEQRFLDASLRIQ
jgi:hypothetical protein